LLGQVRTDSVFIVEELQQHYPKLVGAFSWFIARIADINPRFDVAKTWINMSEAKERQVREEMSLWSSMYMLGGHNSFIISSGPERETSGCPKLCDLTPVCQCVSSHGHLALFPATEDIKKLPPSHLDLNINLLMEPAVERSPLAVMSHLKIEMTKDLRHKCVQLNQRDLKKSVTSSTKLW